MNEISLRVTVATLLAEARCPPEDYFESCERLLAWFKEAQEIDQQTMESGSVSHLSPVN